MSTGLGAGVSLRSAEPPAQVSISHFSLELIAGSAIATTESSGCSDHAPSPCPPCSPAVSDQLSTLGIMHCRKTF